MKDRYVSNLIQFLTFLHMKASACPLSYQKNEKYTPSLVKKQTRMPDAEGSSTLSHHFVSNEHMTGG
jgi:hypothetical protein